MRSNTFNHSLLAIGVAAVLGMSTTANAGPIKTDTTTSNIEITNIATATYKVRDQDQPVVESNPVTVRVSEQVSFSLTAENDDKAQGGTLKDDKNQSITVAPNGYVVFKHTLTNTGNSDDKYNVTIGTTDGIYDQGNSKISYKVYAIDGTTVIRSKDNVPYTTGGTIESYLKKGERVDFTITAKTNGNKGGNVHSLEITATSQALLAKTNPVPPIKTLTNTNSSFTKLPTFGIVKTITNGLDLNNTADTAEYTIVVTNHTTTFGADATDITIEDFLPNGIVMAEALKSTDITLGSNVTVGTINNNSDSKGFNITGVNIPQGQKITIVFQVKQAVGGKITPEQAQSLINHVTVTDDLDDDINTANTLIDSTETSREANRDFYVTPDFNNVDGKLPTKVGDDSTGPLSLATIKRELTLTGETVREIARRTGLDAANRQGQVTHETTITNSGKDIEGNKAGELTFTVEDLDGDTPDLINIVRGTVTIAYPGGTEYKITPDLVEGKYVYDVYKGLPAGIPANGGKAIIRYNVSADDAPMFSPLGTKTPTAERTFVTLIPKAEGAPTVAAVEDITTVHGLVLLKEQAIDATCTGTPAESAFTTLDIGDASPGQCIVYRIKATNTSSALPLGFDIKDMVISDKFDQFSGKADYLPTSLTATNGTTAVLSDSVTTTVATLAPQATTTMQFKVKIKPGLATPNP